MVHNVVCKVWWLIFAVKTGVFMCLLWTLSCLLFLLKDATEIITLHMRISYPTFWKQIFKTLEIEVILTRLELLGSPAKLHYLFTANKRFRFNSLSLIHEKPSPEVKWSHISRKVLISFSLWMWNWNDCSIDENFYSQTVRTLTSGWRRSVNHSLGNDNLKHVKLPGKYFSNLSRGILLRIQRWLTANHQCIRHRREHISHGIFSLSVCSR